jgi:hypothetical protein
VFPRRSSVDAALPLKSTAAKLASRFDPDDRGRRFNGGAEGIRLLGISARPLLPNSGYPGVLQIDSPKPSGPILGFALAAPAFLRDSMGEIVFESLIECPFEIPLCRT